MNISAALSIQTNTIGGSANGQYIDSDKFKQSDLNYFVQVRVTNQRLDKKAFSHLNLVNPVLNTLDEGEQKSLDPNRQNGQVSVQPSTSLPPVTIDPQKFLEIYGVSRPLLPHEFGVMLTIQGRLHLWLGRRRRVECLDLRQVQEEVKGNTIKSCAGGEGRNTSDIWQSFRVIGPEQGGALRRDRDYD